MLCSGGPAGFAARVNLNRAIPTALLAALAAGCAQMNHGAEGAPGDPEGRVASLEGFDHALLGRAMFEETNRVRAANGVRPLAPSAPLDAAADDQASWMALVFRAQHDNPIPGEHDALERAEHAGLAALRVGENAIMVPLRPPAGSPQADYTYRALAAYIVDSWMGSPAHRANLLDPGYRHLGCAARAAHGVLPGDQRVFATQVFFLGNPKEPTKD
jgi:uncharacterized protein YkwD